MKKLLSLLFNQLSLFCERIDDKLMTEEIKKVAKELRNALKIVEEYKDFKTLEYTIDCDILEDYNHNNCTLIEPYKSGLFDKAKKMNGPVLYWFEITEPFNSEVIRNEIINYKLKGIKSVPAMKKTYWEKSNTLYVGKVKRNFWGRIVQHLGYYKTERTQGLQLWHWAKPLKLKVVLHAIAFEPEMEDLVSVLEIKLAKKLRPITGKHS